MQGSQESCSCIGQAAKAECKAATKAAVVKGESTILRGVQGWFDGAPGVLILHGSPMHQTPYNMLHVWLCARGVLFGEHLQG